MFDAEFSAMRMNETHTGTYVYDFHYPVETDHPMRKLFPGASLFYFQYSNVYEKAIDADKVLTNNCGTRITWWCESDEELCDIFYEAAPGYIWGYCVAEIHPGSTLGWKIWPLSNGTGGSGITFPPVVGDWLSEKFDYTDLSGNTISIEMVHCIQIDQYDFVDKKPYFYFSVPEGVTGVFGTYLFREIAYGRQNETPFYCYSWVLTGRPNYWNYYRPMINLIE